MLVNPSLRGVLSPDLWIPGRIVWPGVRRSSHDAIQSILVVAVALRQPIDRSAAPNPSKCSSVTSILPTQDPSSQRCSTLLEGRPLRL